jgi:hypothetical protein
MTDTPNDTTPTDGSTGTGGNVPTTTTTTEPAPSDTDHAAEAAKWRELARKHEDRAKANAEAAKELAKLRESSMSETERAVAEAVANARTETLRSVGSRLVDAEVRTAAAGRQVDVDALLEGLDRSRFLDDDGEPKRDEIVAWVDRIAPANPDGTNTVVDLGQGARGGNGTAAHALNGDPLLRDLKTKLGIR